MSVIVAAHPYTGDVACCHACAIEKWIRTQKHASDLRAVIKEALPLVEDYLQGVPELADKMSELLKVAVL